MTPYDTPASITGSQASSTSEVGMLLGRGVDIVQAAVLAAGEHIGSMNIDFDYRDQLSFTLHLRTPDEPRDALTAGRQVFAQLGVTRATLGPVFGNPDTPIAELSASVPALGGTRLIVVVRVAGPIPTAGDVDALVTAVDAARAAQDEAASRGGGVR